MKATINAALEAVGPRVNQTNGPPRARYYGYAWIDRLWVLEIGNLTWRLPVYYGRFQRQKEDGD